MNRKQTLFLTLLLMALLALAAPALARPGDGFSLAWWTVDGGGGRSMGGDFTLTGSIGQADAGVMAGGEFELTGGFWSMPAATPTHVYLPIITVE